MVAHVLHTSSAKNSVLGYQSFSQEAAGLPQNKKRDLRGYNPPLRLTSSCAICLWVSAWAWAKVLGLVTQLEQNSFVRGDSWGLKI